MSVSRKRTRISSRSNTASLWSAVEAQLRPRLLVGLVFCLLLLDAINLIAARTGAALIALVGAAIAAAHVHREVQLAPRRGYGAAAQIALAVVTALAVIYPVAATMWPGSPLATAHFERAGHLELPANAAGHVRVSIHVPFGPSGAAQATYRIQGLDRTLEGKLDRTEFRGRKGSTQSRLHDSEMLSASVVDGHRTVNVKVSGDHLGDSEVAVYNEYLPWQPQLVLALVMVFAAAVITRRRQLSATVPATVLGAALYGGLAYQLLSPAGGVMRSVGLLFIAGVVAGLFGAAWQRSLQGQAA